MAKRIVAVDWERYAQTFPDRYLVYSAFDALVEVEIVARDAVTVLDIGGGPQGTTYLQRANTRCWLLDPNVGPAPQWMQANLSWERARQMTFDLVVARGCFNYLSKPQIQALPALLNPQGRLMFNTFYIPRSGSREYSNSESGARGVERFRHCSDSGVIEHELEPAGADYIIRHTFFVYTLDEIIQMLGTVGLRFEFLGRNTLLVSLCRAAQKTAYIER